MYKVNSSFLINGCDTLPSQFKIRFIIFKLNIAFTSLNIEK